MPLPLTRTTLAASLASLLLAACASTRPLPQAPSPLPNGAPDTPRATTAAEWRQSGRAAAAARATSEPPARNLILFIGDGMSLTTVAAARILRGQLAGADGEEANLVFERFPATALAKTYTVDSQTPDSAATMTAMISGSKTNNGVLGFDARVRRGRCRHTEVAGMASLFDYAERGGLATGLVTSTRITHATPAATYAHSANRDWEVDIAIPAKARAAGCRDIAAQLIEYAEGDGIDVVFGGGLALFLPEGRALPLPAEPAARGLRGDGRDLLAEWRQRHPQGQVVHDAAALAASAGRSGPLLGLFAAEHLDFELERGERQPAQPSLAELTRHALDRLQDDGRPYLLVVEGGRIDHAHHAGWARRALVDTLAFDDAVAVANERTRADDTLIVVTADHGHTMHFAGYPQRGNPILGLVRHRGGDLSLDDAGRPYTTLGYANGPGAENAGRDLRTIDTTAADFRQPALVGLDSETHGGEDVGVYARGPGAASFRGVFEQHVLFHLLRQAQPQLARQPLD